MGMGYYIGVNPLNCTLKKNRFYGICIIFQFFLIENDIMIFFMIRGELKSCLVPRKISKIEVQQSCCLIYLSSSEPSLKVSNVIE